MHQKLKEIDYLFVESWCDFWKANKQSEQTGRATYCKFKIQNNVITIQFRIGKHNFVMSK